MPSTLREFTHRGRHERVATLAATVVMAVAGLVASARELWAYKTTPGGEGAPAIQWPAVGLDHATERATLVMFAHPRCTCTAASLAELASLLPQLGPIRAWVVVAGEDGPMAARARAIPGVEVVLDPEGAVHASFAVETSGHVLVYDAAGALRFSGGITLARGELGDSPGARELQGRPWASLDSTGTPASAAVAAVFGCPMRARSVDVGGAVP